MNEKSHKQHKEFLCLLGANQISCCTVPSQYRAFILRAEQSDDPPHTRTHSVHTKLKVLLQPSARSVGRANQWIYWVFIFLTRQPSLCNVTINY